MKLYILLFLSALFGITSCSPVRVFSDYDHGTDYSKYKSFAWLQRSDSVQNYWYNNQIIEKNVIHYVNDELTNRNFKIDQSNPDLLVEYHITTKQKQYTVSNPIYSTPSYQYRPNYYNANAGGYGYNPNMAYGYNNTPYIIGYNQQQIQYTEGTLLVDLIDRNTNQLVWRGWSVGTLDDEQDLENQLQKDIHKIMQTFPVPLPKNK